MPMQPTGVYTDAPWMQPYASPGPWSTNEERLTTEALAAATIPGAVLAAQVRPPLPQIQLFPPRFGYRVDALGIDDVVSVSTTFPNSRVDFSQRQSGYSGTSYPSLNQY